jgi:sugar phosphate isomerase/epimerase
MNRIGLEYITLMGTHPLDFIRIAAGAGCANVALFATYYAPAGSRQQSWSLAHDPALRRDVAQCLGDHGVSLALVDGVAVYRNQSVEQFRPLFDVMGELGAYRVNTVSFDEIGRTFDETARLVEMAQPYGITVTMEPCPVLTVRTLAQALDMIRQVEQPNFRLLIDTMHVSRTGEAEAASRVDPGLIDYVQICDAPLAMPPSNEAYMDEAMHERQIPGEGELPLVSILRNVRPDVVVSGEVPLRSLEKAGVSAEERVRRIVDATRRVLVDATG